MTQEKFIGETQTLKKFFTIYCKDKHKEQSYSTQNIEYKTHTFSLELELCDECRTLINYSIEKLQNCPHEVKPRCRTCPSPCYDKPQWKQLAKLMRYSGLQMGLLKIKNFFIKKII